MFGFRAWFGDLGTQLGRKRLNVIADCSLTQNAFRGSGTARHLGPTPLQLHAVGSNLGVCLRAGPELLARNRRVKVAKGRASVSNRAVECRFRARCAGWRFWLWGVKTAISRNGDIEPLSNLRVICFHPTTMRR